MKRKESPGKERVGDPPSSSHPEAEVGVPILAFARRSALTAEKSADQPEQRQRKQHRPIVSIHGRDVETIPDEVSDSTDHAA
jgi:hypothetical protein